MAASAVLQSRPTIIRTRDSGPLVLPTIATDMTSTLRVEGRSRYRPADRRHLRQIALNSYKLSGYVQISQEAIASTAPDLDRLVVDMAPAVWRSSSRLSSPSA